jgi:hypothetical protein
MNTHSVFVQSAEDGHDLLGHGASLFFFWWGAAQAAHAPIGGAEHSTGSLRSALRTTLRAAGGG